MSWRYAVPPADSPMDRAIREVERYTGVPRDRWEACVGHPYNRAALKRAKQLAGIVDHVQLDKLKLARRRAGGMV